MMKWPTELERVLKKINLLLPQKYSVTCSFHKEIENTYKGYDKFMSIFQGLIY
jgi:hypothetical protein